MPGYYKKSYGSYRRKRSMFAGRRKRNRQSRMFSRSGGAHEAKVVEWNSRSIVYPEDGTSTSSAHAVSTGGGIGGTSTSTPKDRFVYYLLPASTSTSDPQLNHSH